MASFFGLVLRKALEMPVVGKAWGPKWRRNREIGCARIIEAFDQRFDARDRPVDQRAGVAFVDRAAFAGWPPTTQPPILQRHRRALDAAEAAVLQDRPLERQLRRKARLHSLRGGHGAGLVIDQQEPA